jgi:hypothetical protein
MRKRRCQANRCEILYRVVRRARSLLLMSGRVDDIEIDVLN